MKQPTDQQQQKNMPSEGHDNLSVGFAQRVQGHYCVPGYGSHKKTNKIPAMCSSVPIVLHYLVVWVLTQWMHTKINRNLL